MRGPGSCLEQKQAQQPHCLICLSLLPPSTLHLAATQPLHHPFLSAHIEQLLLCILTFGCLAPAEIRPVYRGAGGHAPPRNLRSRFSHKGGPL